MIKLTSNPFYILSATPRDSKQKLMQLCNEKSLLENPQECENAFSVLCNPRYRLEAEFFWIPCVSDDKIYDIIENIEQVDYEKLKSLSPITQANILLNRETLDMDYRSSFHCKLLTDLYTYDIQNFMNEINLDREIAGFPRIEDKNELSAFLETIKNEVINKIFEPLKYIGIENVGGEMTKLIREKCSIDHDLMDDVSNYYRILVSQYLENFRADIKSFCKNKKSQSNRVIDENSMRKLKVMLYNYVDIDSPLLLYAELTGNPYDETKRAIALITDFYISLNNDFNEPQKALDLAELVLSKFYMFYDVAENTPLHIEKLKGILVEGYKTLYANEAKRAREKEIREAEEFARQQAEVARQQELKRIKEKKANASKTNSQKKLLLDAIVIDLTHSHYAVAVFKDGNPVFIPNKLGEVSIPAVIAIDSKKNIFFGEEAKKQSFSDKFEVFGLSISQLRKKFYPGRYSPKQLYNLLFQQIKIDAENYLSAQISNCIVVIPVDFSKESIQILTDTAKQAGLDIIRFITASNAQALAYTFEKPGKEEFIFCDIGADSISIAHFDKDDGLLEPLSQTEVGFGRNKFIDIIASYISSNFYKEKNIDIKANKIAWYRLNDAVNRALYDLISVNSVEIELPYIVGNEHLYIDLSKNEVIEAVNPSLQSILQKIKSVSKNNNINKIFIGGNIINLGFVKNFLQNELCGNVYSYIKHGENCAFGGAVLAGVLSGKLNNLLLIELDYSINMDEDKEPSNINNTEKKQQSTSKSNTGCKTQQSTKERDLFQLMKQKNKLNLRYSVNLPIKSANTTFSGFETMTKYSAIVPKHCTCCMGTTNETETITTSISETSGNMETTRTTSLDFPICRKCKEHRQEVKNKKWILNSLSGLSGVIASFLMAVNGYINEEWYVPFVIAVIVYTVLGFVIRTKSLSEEHSAKEKSIVMSLSSVSSNTITFTFSNWLYAKHFAEINGNLNIKEIKNRNQTKANALLLSLYHPLANVFLVLAITLVGLILSAMIWG